SSGVVITKNIEVPSTDPQEIRDIINLQSGRHTPYSRDEIIIDYIDIGTYRQSYTKILLIIVARHIIKRHYEILERAGIKLERVLFAPEGLSNFAARILRAGTDAPPVCIVHIDEGSSDFVVSHKGKPVFVRSIPIGAWNLSEEGLVYRGRFLDEIKRSLEIYQSENIERLPSQAIVTGATESLSDLETTLSSGLQIPAKLVSYFEAFSFSEKILQGGRLSKHASFLEILAPMAAAPQLKLDLIPEEVRLRREVEERGKELIKTGVLVLTLFVLVFSILISKIYFNAAYLKSLDVRYASVNKEAKELEDRFATVGAIKNYLIRRGYSLEVLTELYMLSSQDLQLSDIRFDQQGEKFILRGSAESMSSVFSFVEKMEKSKYLKDVKTKYTTKRKDGGRDVTDFEISAVPTYKGG
ncbi:MAG: pilus assembly protein PilM, partial [Candidatus Omnitrophica bacterium]|nr:pilus assembly protein PilM [Candidatus Omnitrophota bacterium]